jgi:hypothetical protein
VVDEAVARWRTGTHRLADPHASIGYDSTVRAHVDALLALAREVTREITPA